MRPPLAGQALDALRQSEARFRALTEHATDFVGIIDGAGCMAYVSPSVNAHLGYQPEDLEGVNPRDYIHPEDLPVFQGVVGAAIQTGQATQPQELRVRHANGAWRVLEVIVHSRFDDPAIGGIIINAHDVTERSRLAAELRRRTAEAEAMAKVSTALGSVLDPARLYQIILEQAARVLPCDHAAVLLVREQGVEVAASLGRISVPAGSLALPMPLAEPVIQALHKNEPQVIHDTLQVPTWQQRPPFTGPHTIRSVLIVPLVIEGEVLGSFNIDSFTPSFYTEHDLHIATLLAEHVHLALRNVRLFAAEQRRAHAAEALATLRNDFVASVSHELRTPLTGIIGYAELVDHHWETMDDTRRREGIRRIVASANRQLHLVEELLLLSRLETGAIPVHAMALPLADLVRRAAEEVQGSYRDQRIDLDGGSLQVLADAERVVQVLVNLIDNAAKYSPEGSLIAVAWAAETNRAIVRVHDRGLGVPETGREGLFTRFGRVPGSHTRAGRVGTGLGLYLGRQLAQAMGGDLRLEHTGSAGSTFSLSLPLAP